MSWVTRPATTADLEGLVELARRRRERYAEQEPRFWRAAPDAVTVQRSYFCTLLNRDDVAVFVVDGDERVRGFLIASIGDAPAVYDPGGATCTVDDFAVDLDSSWVKAAPLLLAAVRRWAATQGAVQLIVVTGHHDQAKRDQLAEAELRLTSEWWTGPIVN